MKNRCINRSSEFFLILLKHLHKPKNKYNPPVPVQAPWHSRKPSELRSLALQSLMSGSGMPLQKPEQHEF